MIWKRAVVGGVCAMCAAASLADEERTFGRWTFSAGPSWRAGVKTRISGRVSSPPASAAHSGVRYDKDIADPSSWGDLVTVPDPSPLARPDDRLWAVRATRTETIVTPGSGVAGLSSSDDHAPLGLNLSAKYDVWSGASFALGVGVRFAAYFDMTSSTSRDLQTGTVRTRTAMEHWLFQNPPYPPVPPNAYSHPDPAPYTPYRKDLSDVSSAAAGSRTVHARYRADLYQLALGPKATWHALSWLDAYAGAEAILNFAAADFDANRSSTSRTDCLLGFGGHVGLEAKLTDNLGLYGQVGYEWVDTSDVSAGGVHADADFSSLVVSAGVVLKF